MRHASKKIGLIFLICAAFLSDGKAEKTFCIGYSINPLQESTLESDCIQSCKRYGWSGKVACDTTLSKKECGTHFKHTCECTCQK